MEDLKLIFAANLIRLRTEAGLKQSELGEKLNYSDKSVSKWERAEALPDAVVLKRMAEIFGVTVDQLLTDQAHWEPEFHGQKELTFSTGMVTAAAQAGIWTIAMILFVILWIVLDKAYWLIFIWTLPVSLITLLICNCVWHEGIGNRFIVAGIVCSAVVVAYLTMVDRHLWQLFLILVPAEALVFICFRIKKYWKKSGSTKCRIGKKRE